MSKTVKRVSKTVKRVMSVMMVGLIAMLGAKAEAHYFVSGGRPKVCSHCAEAHLEKREDPNNSHTEEADFHLTTIRVDLLCPGGTEVSTTPVNLVVQKEIVQGDATHEGIRIDTNGDRIPIGHARFDLAAKFSDLGLKEALDCSNSSTPTDFIIRATSLKIDTYTCDLNVPRKCILFSTFFKPTCTLPSRYNFNNYPPIGTPYVCP